jgi:hypothetical protein
MRHCRQCIFNCPQHHPPSQSSRWALHDACNHGVYASPASLHSHAVMHDGDSHQQTHHMRVLHYDDRAHVHLTTKVDRSRYALRMHGAVVLPASRFVRYPTWSFQRNDRWNGSRRRLFQWRQSETSKADIGTQEHLLPSITRIGFSARLTPSSVVSFALGPRIVSISESLRSRPRA